MVGGTHSHAQTSFMTTKINASRRGLITGEWLSRKDRDAITLALARTRLGPMPPGFEMTLDALACRNCAGYCESACDIGIVQRYQEGHIWAGAPWLDFSASHCVFCGKCGDACPHICAHSAVIGSHLIGAAVIDPTRCLAFNGVFCISCQGVCDYQAIQRDRLSRPVIHSETCTGCGACVGVCPEQSIRVHPKRTIVSTKQVG